MDLQPHEQHDHKDGRIWLGLAATIIWVLLGVVYISGNVGWSSFVRLPIDDMGTFLEGAFAPLAFLWLVIGLFIQQTVLAENNRELRRTNLQSEKQTLAIAATELNARQETFFKIADNTRKQLGAISGMLFISSQGPVGDANYTPEQIDDLWKQAASGDFEVFSRRFLTMEIAPTDSLKNLLFGTEIRKNHSNNFIVGFDRMLKLARECDTDHIIQDSLIYSAHGLLNGRMRKLHPEVNFGDISVTDSNAYLERVGSLNTEQENSHPD
ncbi:MAG: hypothetical protein JKY98_00720 [Gammaproteobacteria bacterium]|nr:hypothetical protein [Gammaproteobacteria bacterium]